jgi:uncharacterized protein
MRLIISTNSVELEAQLREPEDGALRGAVVICHPHPVYGGTMDNRVVYRTGKAANRAGFAALRFNFRGVGNSTGQYDQGIGEKDDVTAAIDWLEKKYPAKPLAFAGYSFGAWVGLQIAGRDPHIKALLGLGLPLNLYDLDFLSDCRKPALYILGTRDEFCSLENLAKLESRLPAIAHVQRIEGADHFFSGQIDIVEKLITDFFSGVNLEQGSL